MTSESRLGLTWAVLVAATCASVAAAELPRSLIIGGVATMALAIVKALMVLFGFMAAGRLPTGVQWGAIAWCLGCGGMIAGGAIVGL